MTPSYRRFMEFLQVHDLVFVYSLKSRSYFVYFETKHISTIPDTIAWYHWDDQREDEVIDSLLLIKTFG